MMLKESDAILDEVITAWSGKRHWPSFMSDNIVYESNHQGSATGEFAVRQLFEDNFPGGMTVHVNTTNKVVRSQTQSSTIAAYFYGRTTDTRLQNNDDVNFGGMIVINTFSGSVERVRVHMNWLKGNKNIVHHWHFPYERQWQPGDSVSPLISEIDAPWHAYKQAHTPLSDEDAISEAWFQYAWALDMADYSLFNGAFSDDAIADLPPMGKMKGRRMLVSTLKAFRMPWPWIQHYGVPLQIDIAEDRQSASFLLGRIIPEQDKTADGEALYGAHYKIELKKEGSEWKMSRMDYFPGWFTVKNEG